MGAYKGRSHTKRKLGRHQKALLLSALRSYPNPIAVPRAPERIFDSAEALMASHYFVKRGYGLYEVTLSGMQLFWQACPVEFEDVLNEKEEQTKLAEAG